MQEALTAHLLADVALAALVDGRIHWGRLPASVIGRPYVNLTVVSAPSQYHFGGRSNYNQTRVQSDCWAETVSDALAVERSMRARLEAQRFNAAGIRFLGIFVAGGRDLTTDTAGDERALFGKSTDFMIHWAEEP